jgi:hypothetical protein
MRSELLSLLLRSRTLLITAGLFFAVASVHAQISLVHVTSCGSGAFPATVCTIPSSAAGHLLVVAWSSTFGTTPTISGVTDNVGNVYAEAGNARAFDLTNEMVDIWYAKNSNSGATKLTITPNPTGTVGAAVIWEFSNVDTTSPLDQTAVLNSQVLAIAPFGAPVVTSAPSEVVLSVMVPGASILGLHAGSLFTNDLLFFGVGWAHFITSAPGTYRAQWDTVSGTFASSTVAFRAASSVVGALNACDLNQDGTVNVVDVQLAINMDLGLMGCTANLEGLGVCNSDVVNRVTTAALGGSCVVTAISHSVALSWAASTSPGVIGYNVYRSATSGGSYTKLNGSPGALTTYTDSAVQAGQTYYYVVTAVDASSNESAHSNQAQAVVPSP